MESTAPKPFVFVLMPFDPAFDDVYQLGIKRACEDAGAYAERVDEQNYQGSITQRIYNQIAKADVVVADMTGRNANVFYEVGYAHALGKDVIMLTQDAEDIPFDLKDYPHTVYGGRITDLIPELVRRVRWTIEHLGNLGASAASQIEFFLDSTRLAGEPEIWASQPEDYGGGAPRGGFTIAAYNSAKRSLQDVSFKLAFLTDGADVTLKIEGRDFPGSPLALPDGSYIYLSRIEYRLLPGEWQQWVVRWSCGIMQRTGDVKAPVILRYMTTQELHDHRFWVRFHVSDDIPF